MTLIDKHPITDRKFLNFNEAFVTHIVGLSTGEANSIKTFFTKRMNKNDVYLELRKRICLLDYQPGMRLNERELATEFGISRTPMRTVLQKLEHNGLIASQHGHGTIVTSIDLKSMRDIYIVRIRLMDTMGDSTPAPRNPAILDEMRKLEARCEAMLDNHDKREFARVLLRLHTILHGLTNNSVLEEINDTLFFQSAPLVRWPFENSTL